MGLDNFVEQYGLKSFRLGINRINQGKVQLSSDKTVSIFNNIIYNLKYPAIMNLTQKFNDCSSYLYIRLGNCTTELLVSEIYPIYGELISALNACQNLLDMNVEEIKKIYVWNDMFKNKRAADKISADDEKQLLFDIQLAYDKISKTLNK